MSSRTRLYYVAGAIVLTVALYLAPREKAKDTEVVSEESSELEVTVEQAKAALSKETADSLALLEEMLKRTPGDTALMAELGRRWDGQGVWSISAGYFELVAKTSPGERQWLNAAYRYFDAFKAAPDTAAQRKYVESAIRCYQEVIRIAPDNLDAKTDLGVCYAEGSTNPMQGIMMLREVVEKNPDHENAQFNLGVLSVKSGQLDKAVVRFSKVMEIDPRRKDAAFLLARCYADMGQRDKALQTLETLRNDTTIDGLAAQATALYDKLNSNQ